MANRQYKTAVTYLIFLTLGQSVSGSDWIAKVAKTIVDQSTPVKLIYEVIKEAQNEYEPNKNYYDESFYEDELLFPGTKKTVELGDTSVTFQDVRGDVDEIKQEVQETIEFLKHPHKYISMGAELPRGLLLEGPPGTGKTLIARAIAGEAKCAFFHAAGSDFHKKYIGDGPEAIRELFRKARQNTPAIVFIDEIDGVAGKRSGDSDSAASNEFRAIVNELLNQMDGFKTDASIIVIGATNFASALDPALLRPGRFTRIIQVDLPSKLGRIDILQYYLGKIPEDRLDLDINKLAKEIAQQTSNFSPAELKNIINEATLIAVRNDSKTVQQKHFINALDRVQLGIKKKLEQTHEQLSRTAYHEAGHALIKILKKESVSRITIEARGFSLGATVGKSISDTEISDLTEEKLLNKIMAAQGGAAAEETVFGAKSLGIADDQRQADYFARLIIEHFGTKQFPGGIVSGQSETMKYEIDKAAIALRARCYQDTLSIIKTNLHLLERLTKKLLEKETLAEDQIYAALGIKKPN